jgi:SAM-dependent methyltransferase
VKLGVETMLGPDRSAEHLKTIVAPVNYWRSIEYRLVLEALRARSEDRILDLGSPKLLSIYLADVVGARVVAVDLVDEFLRRYRAYQNGRLRGRPCHALLADGRTLPFRDGSFDKIYSISVLEHIDGEGDSECAAQLGRALRPGGICAITVPFAPAGAVETRARGAFYWAPRRGGQGERVFYQRRYSEADLHRRLIEPSGLVLDQVLYMGERFMSWTRRELSEFLPPAIGPLHPGLSRLFHVTPSTSWQRLAKPLGALVVLRKA